MAADRVPHLTVRAGRILVVEDSPQNQDLIQAVLRRDGHSCTPAFDGVEGLAAATAGGFDLVIMDMQMPRMDGIAATMAIRALPAPQGTVPILALSANALPHQVAAMADAGGTSHLAKPFAIDDLSQAVAGVLSAGLLSADHVSAGPAQAGLTDPASLDALADLLGPDWARTRLEAVIGGLGWTEADLPLPDLRRNAHRLISESGQLGLVALGEAAARLEQALDAGASIDAYRATLQQAATATRRELPALLARLDTHGA